MKNLTFNDKSQQQENNGVTIQVKQTDKKINETEDEIEEIKNIMKNNIEKMMYRGVNLTDLKDSCDNLEAQAAQFQVISRKVRRKMYFKSKKKSIILICVIIFIFMFILLVGFLIFYFFYLKTKI